MPYPCLWFNNNALEAAQFYCSVFKDSKIISQNPMVVMFELKGQKFMGLNGGNQFAFSEATSFVINCNTQEEIDFYWEKLTEGGQESMCGWLKDKFGVSWQVVPTILVEILSSKEKAQIAGKRMMFMRKFIIADLLKED